MKDKSKVAIIGASGHGKVIVDIARANGICNIVFYDDRWQDIANLFGVEVVGNVTQALRDSNRFDAVYVSIGNSKKRADIQGQLTNVGTALVHPSATVSSSVRIGDGTVVMPNAVINADTIIGNGVIVNSGAVIEHDCIVKDFAHICPNAALAGGVKVGEQSWIGIGSSVIQLTTIGDFVTVGAGAVIINNIPDNETVVGNPAQPIKR